MKALQILIVDDNRDLSDCLAILLEDQGYEATVAYCGEDAVARVLIDPFDVIIIDMKLPGMDGTDVFRAIQELRPNTKGIMMTGYSVENSLKQAISDGAICALRKPFPMDILLSKLAEIKQLEIDSNCDHRHRSVA